jgi:hypothetical protein
MRSEGAGIHFRIRRYFAVLIDGFFLMMISSLAAQVPAKRVGSPPIEAVSASCETEASHALYIPVDSWIYSAVARLESMGYASGTFMGMRPWTPANVLHMLSETPRQIREAIMYGDLTVEEAESLYTALLRGLLLEGPCSPKQGQIAVESTYTVLRGVSGPPLMDSFHLGQTIINDFGRPVQNGLNSYTGASGHISAGRFVVYARGEFQQAPPGAGYSYKLSQTLLLNDFLPFIDPATGLPYNQAIIPLGPIAATHRGSVLEAYASA